MSSLPSPLTTPSLSHFAPATWACMSNPSSTFPHQGCTHLVASGMHFSPPHSTSCLHGLLPHFTRCLVKGHLNRAHFLNQQTVNSTPNILSPYLLGFFFPFHLTPTETCILFTYFFLIYYSEHKDCVSSEHLGQGLSYRIYLIDIN